MIRTSVGIGLLCANYVKLMGGAALDNYHNYHNYHDHQWSITTQYHNYHNYLKLLRVGWAALLN
jgi:hypothetical protein